MKNAYEAKFGGIRESLVEDIKREATKWFRIARRAKAKGCSDELVYSIRNEACDLMTNVSTYPDRVLRWDFQYSHKYAFKI